ncbi:DUF305 domain-containing protein [Solwaraspora sp. WMMB335]|uniref:DUF305 domain-containing protein n=1 Tax=Solwaraspora sp. WMMB335 TaxID=3404118 RepID=UPI003B932D32
MNQPRLLRLWRQMPKRRTAAITVVAVSLVAITAVVRSAESDHTTRIVIGSSTTDDESTATGQQAGDPPVILPGRPGESSEVRPGSDVVIDPPQYNAVDTWYVQMMIPHHTQAVQMAALAAERTDHVGVRAFADRIRASQAAEITVLKSWLAARDLPAGDHDHDTMPGMQTEQAIRELAAARGAGFDSRFVAMMTAHHEGAIEMSERVLTGGSDLAIEELATSIAAEQTVEISRMQELLVS